jgi:hypothetical protein
MQWLHLSDHEIQPRRWRQHSLRNVGFQPPNYTSATTPKTTISTSLFFTGFRLHSITRAVCKIRELTLLLLRVGNLWRCGDSLFEVPPLISDALLTTLHPFLEKLPQTVCRKLQEDSEASGFDPRAPFSWLDKPRNRMGRDLDCMTDFLTGVDLGEGIYCHFSIAQR